MKKLAIIGSGDLGQQIAYHALADKHYTPVGYFDDFEEGGNIKHGLPILGKVVDVERLYYEKQFDVLMIGVGYKHFLKRFELFSNFKNLVPFGSIIHSSSYVDPSCKIGNGIFIYPGCILDMNVKLEDNVLLNVGCVIAHDTVILANTILSPAVKIAGFVTVGRSVNLGIGTIVIDNITIVDSVKTGGGAVVIDNINEAGIYVGVPARKINFVG